jgi:hypothetical protein
MRLFHRTAHGDAIVREGFRDGQGTYLTANVYRGVWLSDRALDSNEGAEGNDLVCVEIPEEVMVTFEWVNEPFMGYREFLVPARIVNLYRRRRAFDCSECRGVIVPPGPCPECGCDEPMGP